MNSAGLVLLMTQVYIPMGVCARLNIVICRVVGVDRCPDDLDRLIVFFQIPQDVHKCGNAGSARQSMVQ